jgi:hypothetical protein
MGLRDGPSGSADRVMALRARAIEASTRLLPSRWWRRTAGPRPKQVLGYLVGRRDRSGSWWPFGLTGEASPPYSSTPYATGDGEARRSGIVQSRQCNWASVGSRCSGVIGAPSVLCGLCPQSEPRRPFGYLGVTLVHLVGCSNDVDRVRASNDGVVCYLRKPVDEQRLVECLRAALTFGGPTAADS